MVKPEHVIPKFPNGESALMVAGLASGPKIAASSAWLDWFEELFAEFGLQPRLGSAHFTENFGPKQPGSGGYFKNIRKKVAKMLDSPDMTDRLFFVNFNTLSHSDVTAWGLEGDLFACVGKSNRLPRYEANTVIAWALRCPPAYDPLDVMSRIDQRLVDYFSPGYGFSTFFPAAWKWGLQAAGVLWVPQHWDDRNDPDNLIYEKRVDRCARVRPWEYRPERGWLREVYTVNLINDRHLAAPFNGATLGDYIASHGNLARNIHGSELHRWHVPDDIIDQVRNDLEPSGLILSSETEPLALPA